MKARAKFFNTEGTEKEKRGNPFRLNQILRLCALCVLCVRGFSFFEFIDVPR
jgi:hypothetical protein